MSQAAFGYHPEYGLPDEIRLRAVFDAKAVNVKAAAETNNVSVASIYKWRKKLKETNK
jgi:transposase-like protein